MSEFYLDKPLHISKKDIFSRENILNIPVSVHKDSIEKPLNVIISDGIITHIDLIIDSKLVNFLDIIKDNAKLLRKNHKDNITSFDKDFKFYLLKNKYQCVLAIKTLSDNLLDKIRYSINGVILNHVTDRVLNNLI